MIELFEALSYAFAGILGWCLGNYIISLIRSNYGDDN